MKKNARIVASVVIVIVVAYFIAGFVGILPSQYDLVRGQISTGLEAQMEYHDSLVYTDMDGYFSSDIRPYSITTTNSDYLVVSASHYTNGKYTEINFIDKNFTEMNTIDLGDDYDFREMRYESDSDIAYDYEYEGQYFIMIDVSEQEVIDLIDIRDLSQEQDAEILDVAEINGHLFILMKASGENGIFVVDDQGQYEEHEYIEYDEWICIDVAMRSSNTCDVVLGGYDYVSLSEYDFEGEQFDMYKVVGENPYQDIAWYNCRISSEGDFKNYAWFYGNSDYPQDHTLVTYWDYFEDEHTYDTIYDGKRMGLRPYPCDNSYFDETLMGYDGSHADGSDRSLFIYARHYDITDYYYPSQTSYYAYDVTVDNYYNYSVYTTGYHRLETNGQTSYYGIHCLYNDYKPPLPPPVEEEEIRITVTQVGVDGKGTVGTPIPIKAIVESDNVIQKVLISYRNIGESQYQTIAMELISGNTKFGNWSGEIPAQNQAGIVTCQVYAESLTGGDAYTEFFNIPIESVEPAPAPVPAFQIDPAIFYGLGLLVFSALGIVINRPPIKE